MFVVIDLYYHVVIMFAIITLLIVITRNLRCMYSQNLLALYVVLELRLKLNGIT